MRCNRRPSLSLEDISIYVSLVGIQISFGVLSVLTGNEISKGISTLLLVFYSNGFGASVLCPFAFFLDKERRSKMSLGLLAQVLLISLTRVSAFQALLLMGMSETSPAFASGMTNLVPAIVFVMAWTLGLEKVDMKHAPSQFKIVGTLICVCGAMAMSFITGPALMHLTSWPSTPHSSNTNPVNILPRLLQEGNSAKRIKGCIFLLAAAMILSSSMILQTKTLKKYPAPLSLTTMTGLLGSIETAILIMSLDKGVYRASWILDWSGVVTVIYGGVACHGLGFALQLWCLEKRGPVFVAIFYPVATVCSAILSWIFLRETLHVGSAIGILLIFGGLYSVLWGKSKSSNSNSNSNGKVVEEQINNAEVSHVKRPLLC